MEILQFDDVSFSYAGSDKMALNHISFDVQAGEFVLLCGASGCGKTTLLRHIKTALTPCGKRSGAVLFHGKEIDDLPEETKAQAIGYVGQHPEEQIVTDKVWHELSFGLENMGQRQDVMLRRIAEVSEFFGITDWFEKSTDALSGGEMQLLNLASTMVTQPEILLLDEPTSQLDPIAASNFLHMLKRLQKELGTTILICEHHLEEVFCLADRVLVMSQGAVKFMQTPQNAAKRLCDEKGALYDGLPSALRIALALHTETAEGDSLPLTIGEGKRWLHESMGQQKREYIESFADGEKKEEEAEREGERRERRLLFHREKKTADEDAITIKHLEFSYGSKEKTVLSDCTFSVKKGEWFCLLGGNGAGKSTLLKLMCQTLRETQGSIHFFGKPLSKETASHTGYRKAVFLPQNPKALFTEITVWEELWETMEALPFSEEEKKKRVTKIMEQVGLAPLEGQHPYDLSGGEQQMLALGKLLLLEPRILLLDEPTKGLDPQRKKRLGAFFKELCAQGTTLFMVSHDIEFCAEYADCCAMLFQGRVVGAGNTRDFFSGNSFFTTAANRIGRDFFPTAVTCGEVVEACKT